MTKTPQSSTPASTGDSKDPTQSKLPSPAIGWHEIRTFLVGEGPEGVIRDYLELRGYPVKKAGSRWERHDLEILSGRQWQWIVKEFDGLPVPNLSPGRYEVKSLYRRKPTHAWDRRFKTGSRGESIYGRRDAEIKSFALDLEDLLDRGKFPYVPADRIPLTTIDDMHSMIDAALERRHSKSFMKQITDWASVYEDEFGVRSAANLLAGSIKGPDIVGAFSDITGIIVLAGAYFTVIGRDEISSFIEFDSVSVEGVKLRYVGHIET